MEAFIVPPPQPQKFQPQNSGSQQSDHSEKNSEFGSTLDQAISNNSAVESDEQHAHSPTENHTTAPGETLYTLEETVTNNLDDEVDPRQDLFNPELIPTIANDQNKVNSDLLMTHSSDIETDLVHEILNSGKNVTNKDHLNQIFQPDQTNNTRPINLKNQDVNFTHSNINQQVEQKSIGNLNQANSWLPLNEAHGNIVARVAQQNPATQQNNDPLSSLNKDTILRDSVQHGNNVLRNHLAEKKPQISAPINTFKTSIAEEDKLSLLQKNDTIGWSTKLSKEPHVMKHNPILNVGYRIEAETTNMSQPTLSTEKVMEGLTKISGNLEPQLPAQSLRNEVPTLRQGIAAQFMEAKLDQQTSSEGSAGQQQFSMESEKSSQPQQMVTVKGAEGGDVQFTNTLNQTSSDKPVVATDFSKPASNPLAPQVSEENVIQQVLQRFRLSKSQLDSKMIMKLHPAELGELKLDVQLKNGTINASIVAQTRQVQEILEKNLPRLREMMEQQGLQVEDITIDIDTDSTPDFNMFEEHLAGDDESTSRKRFSNNSSQFSMDQEEDADELMSDLDSMVNLKA